MHPGPITNVKDLCEVDKDHENIFGTGTLKNMEAEYLDQYVEQKRNQEVDMCIFNEELWTFLFKRYGGEIIKRRWSRLGSGYYTRVDVKLQSIKVAFLNSQLL